METYIGKSNTYCDCSLNYLKVNLKKNYFERRLGYEKVVFYLIEKKIFKLKILSETFRTLH